MRSVTVAVVAGSVLLLLVGAPMAFAKPAEHQFSGEVSRIDPGARTLAVKEQRGKTGMELEMTFTLAPGAKIVQGSRPRSLADLEVGDRVKVSYAEQGSANRAQRVELLAASTAEAKPASPSGKKPGSSY